MGPSSKKEKKERKEKKAERRDRDDDGGKSRKRQRDREEERRRAEKLVRDESCRVSVPGLPCLCTYPRSRSRGAQLGGTGISIFFGGQERGAGGRGVAGP